MASTRAPDKLPILRRDVVALSLCVAFWILPISQGALVGTVRMFDSPTVRQYYRISCLFGVMSSSVHMYHVEFQRRGSPAWEVFDEPAYFKMEPFGNRTRFDRFMTRWARLNSRARREFVRWLTRRDREQHPEFSPISRVRFLVTPRRIRPESPPRGAFQKPRRPPRGKERVHVLAVHEVEPGAGG